jgi:hypothetical protein
VIDYATARPLIADGDCILVRETHGFLTPFTRFFSRSAYTHAGIALWMDDGLWMAELNSGKNHAVPLCQLSNTDFDVYHCPVDREAAVIATLDALHSKISYGIAALFVIGLLNWLRITVFLHARKILVCSGYVVAIYEAAGWSERSRMISPQELATQLKLKIEVRAGPPAVQ